MAVLHYIIGFVLYVWFGLSPVIWLYWQFHPESEPTHKFGYYVFCGMFLGINILLMFGFESVLFFIPSSWELRHILAGCLGFLCFVGFLLISNKAKELQLENENLRRLVEEQNKIVTSEQQEKENK